jgi:hypothetical protein
MPDVPGPPTWIQTLSDVVIRVGVPTVLAAVLLWFLLVQVQQWLTVARETQLEMLRMLERCCPHGGGVP